MAADERAAASDGPVTVEDVDHFESLGARHDLLVAAFYGDWCGPRVVGDDFLAPVAEETPATVAKVDVEVNTDLAAAHAVRRLPTVLLVRDGEPVERLVGVEDGRRVRRAAERYVE
jgi:thioredoxin 1